MRILWSPVRDILQRHARLGQALGEPGVRTWGRRPRVVGVMPRLDFSEAPEAFIVRLDLPGVRRESVEVSVADGNLEIEGRIPNLTATDDDCQVHRAERFNGPFRRVLPLPRQADADAVSASMSDGVLTVEIAKRAADSGRIIPVD